MIMKKVLAGAMASVMAVSAMAVYTSAAENNVDPNNFFIDFSADGMWYWGNTDDNVDAAKVPAVKLEGNGSYTATVDLGSDKAPNLTELCLHIYLADGDALWDTLKVAIKSIKVDGTELAITGTGTTEADANGLRTFICASWKSEVKIVDISTVGEWSKLEVNFDVSGLDYDKPAANEPDSTPAPDPTPDSTPAPTPDPGQGKPDTDTGIEGVAVVAGLAVLAAGAIVITKKRK